MVRRPWLITLFLSAVTALAGVSAAGPGPEPSRLDIVIVPIALPAHLEPCGAAPFVWRVAQQAGLSLGLERMDDGCRPSDVIRASLGPPVSARAALGHLTARIPAYGWRQLANGVVIVRPVTAWDDAENILNRRVEAFTASEHDLDSALHTLSVAFDAPGYDTHDAAWLRGTTPFRVAFEGGTLLDALNTLVSQRRDLGWEVDYQRDAAGRARPRLSLFTYEESYLRTRTLRLPDEPHP